MARPVTPPLQQSREDRPAAEPCHSRPLLHVRGLNGVGLADVSFDLAAGECLAVLGPSGSGKSLLLRALADLDPNSGEVSLAGVARSALRAPEWRRRVTYAAAEPGWWAVTVGDHFADWAAAAPWVRRFRLSEDCAAWPVDRLSTGEAQRLGLIRVLVQSPRVLLLDEPTSALDEAGREAVETAVKERLDGGAAALWVTHDREQARRMAKRCLRMDRGRAVETAP